MSRLSYLKIYLSLSLQYYGDIYYVTPSCWATMLEILLIEWRDFVRHEIVREYIRYSAVKMNLLINKVESPYSPFYRESLRVWFWGIMIKLKFKIWIG